MLTKKGHTEQDGQICVPADVRIERRADGTAIITSNIPLQQGVSRVTEWLENWARLTPDAVLVGHRQTPDQAWRTLGYAQALVEVERLAAGLLAKGLSSERPLAILSDNSIESLLLTLAAMHVGIPVAGITSAYSLVATDYSKLVAMIELVTPGLIYVDDGQRFAKPLEALSHLGIEIAALTNVASTQTSYASLASSWMPEDVAAAKAGVNPSTVSRILFTSGSTGVPKGVINTHRMHITLAEAKSQLWPIFERMPPKLVDWLPWSHAFGANHNLFMVLRNGGALYIDAGRPAPGLIDTTIANIRDIGPNFYANVPRGFDMLVRAMEADASFRNDFFASVKVIFYAAAALPPHLWDKLNALSVASKGEPTMMVSAWGSTETSPLATDCHFQADQSGNLGVPIPGAQLKLVPSGDKLEVRVRGPNVFPGYLKNEELTREAFDEEGFYRIGDAVRLADERDPNKGVIFDGRVSEDFKLSTSTWVNTGTVRLKAIAALSPIAQDVVVAGQDKDFIGFLVFPDLNACRRIAGLPDDASIESVLSHPAVRTHVHTGMTNLKNKGEGSSSFGRTALIMATPPSINEGEITDKGYINQRRVLTLRAEQVAELFLPTPSDKRIDIG